ncbi:hypothetical protein F751_6723 [Auxenochlorella protothecoides]|uniref:Uncharacterized protein n=1 Tax=Auxenochlorella protothecoides TaxID=3075 RepID=A0A087SAD8_AUXPR|nr:hypothetical protein F751_6723 [Auxenochlorella protothecoides]KFM22692.1 hypothetical protein F751_6723 [Auxenochlorella protothecoides]
MEGQSAQCVQPYDPAWQAGALLREGPPGLGSNVYLLHREGRLARYTCSATAPTILSLPFQVPPRVSAQPPTP